MNLISRMYNGLNLFKLGLIFKEMDRYRSRAAKVSDAALKDSLQRLKQNSINEWDLLPGVFCLVEECFKRYMGINVYTEQLFAGAAMHEGFMVEMKTGEGKTIAACFTAVLNSLFGKVYIVTVNDYISQRDLRNMKPVYDMLGITCSANFSSHKDKRLVYSADIVYTSSSEFAFDYLTNEFMDGGRKIDMPLDFVILDEADFILLDNATSYFSVSDGRKTSNSDNSYVIAKELCEGFEGMELKKESSIMFSSEDLCRFDKEYDYVYSRHDSSVYITARGHDFVGNIIKSKLYAKSSAHLYRALLDTLYIKSFYERDKDYLVRDGRIILISRENGRLMLCSELEKGLQTALQLKESVKLTGSPLSENSISYQVLFSKFKKLAGMSGTLEEAEKEFSSVLGLPAAYIPRHSRLLREDHDLSCYKTLKEKYDAAAAKVAEINRRGQPVLLVAGSEKEACLMHTMLLSLGVQAILLSCDIYDSLEEQAKINNAGKLGSVTVTTNMAGRSTDIVPDEEAIRAGGLFVLSLQHYMNPRIDEQLKGRAGRQGQRGECQFFISMEDRIWDYVEKDRYNRYCDIDDSEFYSKKHVDTLSKAIKSIQTDISRDNMVLRKVLIEFDLVMDRHRQVIMQSKGALLKSDNTMEILKYLAEFCSKSDVMEQLEGKVNRFGEVISLALFRKITCYVFDEGYMVYRKSLEYIRNSIYLRVYNARDVLTQYVEVVSECLAEFERDLAEGIITMFLQAELRRDSKAG